MCSTYSVHSITTSPWYRLHKKMHTSTGSSFTNLQHASCDLQHKIISYAVNLTYFTKQSKLHRRICERWCCHDLQSASLPPLVDTFNIDLNPGTCIIKTYLPLPPVTTRSTNTEISCHVIFCLLVVDDLLILGITLKSMFIAECILSQYSV